MADNNLFKGLKPDTKLSRNGFDWSGRDTMTFQCGALYPIWNKSLIPNEEVTININHILRTFPMSAPNFNRNRAHFEFFFVPYSQIWKPWNEFYLKRADRQRSRDLIPELCVPSFDPVGYKKHLVDTIINNEEAGDIHGYSLEKNALRLCDLLGYGSVLGYDNSFADLLPDPDDESYSDALTALINCFGVSETEYLNIFKIAAYQKIWSCYYRDSVHDTSDYSFSFNFDDVVLGGANDVVTSRAWDFDQLTYQVFQQRYRSYKKDLFTNAYPAQQFGDVSSVSFHDVAIGADFDNEDIGRQEAYFGLTGEQTAEGRDSSRLAVGINTPSKETDLFDIPNAFDVYSFYRAEAVQLWRERAMRAGNRYKDNYKAHFGVVPKYLEDDYPDFVGSFSKLISIDDVTSTAQTSEGDLGALAGKGIAVDQTGNLTYKCRDFGVLMCMFSIVPEMDYNATGYDKDNMALTAEQFIIPEYDKLGLENISLKEFTTNQPRIGFHSGRFGDNPPVYNYHLLNGNTVLGFNPRFYSHKARVNKVHGRFQYNAASLYKGQGFSLQGTYNGDLSMFVQSMQKTMVNNEGFSIGDHYINPNVCDSMFSVNSDGTEHTDRFFGAIQVNCDSIQPLSVTGLHAI